MQCDINQLIADNKGLIFKQLHAFNLVNEPDAESLGYEALRNALLTYKQGSPAKLSTYASVCIYNALCTFIRQQKRVRQLEVVSYNAIAYSENGIDHEFIDFIGMTQNILDELCSEETRSETREAFLQQFTRLNNEKHRTIIALWDESDYTASTTDIACAACVSQSYVSQVINNFKNDLRKRLRND